MIDRILGFRLRLHALGASGATLAAAIVRKTIRSISQARVTQDSATPLGLFSRLILVVLTVAMACAALFS